MSQQERLSNEEFLSALTSLLSSTHTASHGSVFLTQKSLLPTDTSTSVSQTLIRATNGAASTKKKPHAKVSREKLHESKPKVKLATVVEPTDLEDFYTKYAEVCKKGMDSMRKRDKKKAKEKAKAAKKKKGTTNNA